MNKRKSQENGKEEKRKKKKRIRVEKNELSKKWKPRICSDVAGHE